MRSYPRIRAPILFLLLFVVPSIPAEARQAVVRVDENVRFEPQGQIVARLVAGTEVHVEEVEGSWSRITFEGAVWESSLQRRDGGAFDVIVSADEGENLRDVPGGRVIGHLNRGTLLHQVASSPGWIQVRRTAWMWSASLQTGTPSDRPAPPPTPSDRPAPSPAPADPGGDWVRARSGGSPLFASPDGDTLAVAREGSELRVIGREGNWARVRVEGWVWLPPATTDLVDEGGADDVVLTNVRPAEIAADPERYRGRLVSLVVQFISIERAEAVRTDFLEGEPFLLARSSDGARTFVYIAVPSERLADVERLQPLQRLEIIGRVRAAAARLTGNPVLELVELREVR